MWQKKVDLDLQDVLNSEKIYFQGYVYLKKATGSFKKRYLTMSKRYLSLKKKKSDSKICRFLNLGLNMSFQSGQNLTLKTVFEQDKTQKKQFFSINMEQHKNEKIRSGPTILIEQEQSSYKNVKTTPIKTYRNESCESQHAKQHPHAISTNNNQAQEQVELGTDEESPNPGIQGLETSIFEQNDPLSQSQNDTSQEGLESNNSLGDLNLSTVALLSADEDQLHQQKIKKQPKKYPIVLINNGKFTQIFFKKQQDAHRFQKKLSKVCVDIEFDHNYCQVLFRPQNCYKLSEQDKLCTGNFIPESVLSYREFSKNTELGKLQVLPEILKFIKRIHSHKEVKLSSVCEDSLMIRVVYCAKSSQ